MSTLYTVVDQSHWKRAMHCAVFRNCIEPAFCITVELDVTHFYRRIKELGYPFTYSLIYLVSQAANEIEEFRYRFLEGQVVLYQRIHTAFTYLNPETELFKVVNVPLTDTLEEYVALADRTQKEQQEYFTGPLGRDVFQFSPLPWLCYTHISHTNAGNKDNATPLFDWGKWEIREGKRLLPFSIQAHHSFVDGLHVARLVEKIQNSLDNL